MSDQSEFEQEAQWWINRAVEAERERDQLREQLVKAENQRDEARQASWKMAGGKLDWREYVRDREELMAQLASARKAAIEECAAVLDRAAQDWNELRDPGMANNARKYARHIRELTLTDEEGKS